MVPETAKMYFWELLFNYKEIISSEVSFNYFIDGTFENILIEF